MRRNKFKEFFFVFSFVFVLVGCHLYVTRFDYCREYIPGKWNIKGSVDTESFSARGKEFEIGANRLGYAVFKHKEDALKKLKENYASGIILIQNEYHLDELNPKNYELYKVYGWQVITGTDEEKKQALFVTDFFDIYENSFANGLRNKKLLESERLQK